MVDDGTKERFYYLGNKLTHYLCLIIFSLCTIRTNVCKEMNLYV